ncbi:bifunctional [glutamine synthetase] adenylyltransferase/[glutamine synthetase]-adenylyl-L-tyrosine phosphorylase [Actinomyces urogenitalis]|uniref:bifunctional [glutamine synthetase] adenylyltransferase/[glutamine synthetase]-adenylyl-L-tyrosine phosphorylase n=1 Tax=Actinomyces urogenitalis TaxID=103621 RepID=UPI00254C9EA4|nr:bifunctional [glutamine synthetase] adenylyltransferase/[glutamine synthetase]-adenylyl-L-tyrosine phosphorylase [Actinomyces urogenitalis]MDK8236749.1 bifunctional [glutamine synthetase] adenylyltransferase/[glutamine synthetase]-adenylyl-L-tyrosine phosphorylase [Actinomyces urogenitalis]WOO94814.1 bifunctional [glutamine synthetase] adenylyltransferase/[glutamine synthetase]-adenylyl-L-tyrosine phosphorylase [Actinomyces urogenitalis]
MGGELPPTGARQRSVRSRLLAAGFQDSERARACLEDAALRELLADPPASHGPTAQASLGPAAVGLVQALGRTADPDLALLTLVRLAHEVRGPSRSSQARLLASLLGTLTAAQDPQAEPGARGNAHHHLRRLLAVLGASSALGDFLVAHPQCLTALHPSRSWQDEGPHEAAQVLGRAVRDALSSCQERSQATTRATAALRVAYRDRLLAIAADDLCAADPLAHTEVVGTRMAQLADAALETGLLVARHAVGPAAAEVALAVIAMGKTGACELNYISDVDVVYVVAPAACATGSADEAAQAGEERLLITGTALATELARVVSASGTEPPLWPLDTGLRPEGKDGALVRTLASHLTYYERWASSWEFQALLKARACAGNPGLGRAYEEGVAPLVWEASRRENFVDDARAMRQRVEHDSARPGTQDRRIKLGPGGLRDVEFTVQLLQLVHGRADESLRVRGTLRALAALSAGGYVSREDAAVLDHGYRTLRLLEHRSQLLRLRRTHELPSRQENLRRIGRGIDREHLADPEELRELFQSVRRQVRSVHESVYYRPLLGAAAALSRDEMAMAPRAAHERLAAGGYLDPDGALHHIQALTEGVSRRAAIQRQLLPVMIGWLGDGPDPDTGLLSFRRLSEAIGGSHWYLAMLRDSPVAARRLCHVLSGARWTTDRLAERPEAIAWLDDDAELRPRPGGALREEVTRLVRRRLPGLIGEHRQDQAVEAVHALLSVRSRELLRAALADSLDGLDPERTAQILTDATDAVLDGALAVATALTLAESADPGEGVELPGEDGRWPQALADYAIIAMGRLGGCETTYASDADVLFVHQPRHGADERAAAAQAEEVARRTLGLLTTVGPHPLALDADLRPEGRQGPMSRSLDSYRDYYARWSGAWERQALLRARACAGSAQVGRAFEDRVAPLRWSEHGLAPDELRQIRRLKARMESERLPRGADPGRHLKLGPGGLSDVEWAVQVLQLQHAGRVGGLRTTSTLTALRAAALAGLLTGAETTALVASWETATRLRSANVIGTGRDGGARVDVLPSDPRQIRVVGRLIGLAPGHERDLEDTYRRMARHARPVAARLIFGSHAPEPDDPAGGLANGQPRGRAAADERSAAVSNAAPGPGQAGGTTASVGDRPEAGETPKAEDKHGKVVRRPAHGRPRSGTGPYPWS